MKSRIFMYLFVFALMYVIFQYANSKRYSEAMEKEVSQMEQHIDSLKNELATIKHPDKFSNEEGFTLRTNPSAKEFFEDQNINVDSLVSEIQAQIISKNSDSDGNSYVPFTSGSSAHPFRINTLRVLNNRWIFAGFSNDRRRGGALISFYLDDDGKLHLEPMDGTFYN